MFFLSRTSDDVKSFSEMLKVLVDHHYQPTASAQDRDEAKAGLETMLGKLSSILETNKTDAKVIERVKALKPILYNVYKDARQSSR